MKKAFDQTIRDIKREVNKIVLKVPSIEQKVLDATSNEPWGPHGSLLADLAQASRNYHEYQMIMVVIWKRINDTGKNWRHVYKALTVLEYLVANGSERVIDEIREHAYQISVKIIPPKQKKELLLSSFLTFLYLLISSFFTGEDLFIYVLHPILFACYSFYGCPMLIDWFLYVDN